MKYYYIVNGKWTAFSPQSTLQHIHPFTHAFISMHGKGQPGHQEQLGLQWRSQGSNQEHSDY